MFIVRYELISTTSKTTMLHKFATEAGAKHFLSTALPRNATAIDCWTEQPEEGRQRPTYGYEERSYHPWWDANKRPFSDRYDVAGEA